MTKGGFFGQALLNISKNNDNINLWNWFGYN